MSQNGSVIETEPKTREKIEYSAPIFPKVLPVVIPGGQYDELGFSLTEKVALRQAFDLIKPFRRKMGKDIFYTYLVQHEDVIDIFRKNGDLDEKINLTALHKHAQTMMRTIHFVVNKGLDDMPSFHMMAHDIVNIHVDHWVPKAHVQVCQK
ncbi:uncharacterized protein Dwil_GK17234 [Drosophila willistoni]|uniref:Globin domain-containing protein n=1 Tax=Drosophila willistoni TaxID=7260 RepID=B4MLL1_DROWI|nr:uncharacterized protein Dwil_GK17234 [Drosophila willistoni]